MTCTVLNSGHSLLCRDGVGGINKVYFMLKSDLASYAQTLGVATAIVKKTTKRFWAFELDKQTSFFNEVGTGAEAAGTFFLKQDLQISIVKMQATTQQLINALATNLLVAVAVDNNGKGWLLGANGGLLLVTSTAGTGTAMGDKNGYMLAFEGFETSFAVEVPTNIISTLETAGV